MKIDTPVRPQVRPSDPVPAWILPVWAQPDPTYDSLEGALFSCPSGAVLCDLSSTHVAAQCG